MSTSINAIGIVQTMILNGWTHLTAAKELGINSNTLAFWFATYYQEANNRLVKDDKINDFAVSEEDKAPKLTGVGVFMLGTVRGEAVQQLYKGRWIDISLDETSLCSILTAFEKDKLRLKPQQVVELEQQLKELNSIQ